ncbi:MAG: chorismate transformation enzyme, FkbO/Hyg5 family [Planctomycetota bacterium]|jgi:enamine deaminase RidA (YjgF/YER057c/UK114 family)
MIAFDVEVFAPCPTAVDCLRALDWRLKDRQRLLSLTFFSGSPIEGLADLVRARFGSVPTTVVAQPPLGRGGVALEAAVLAAADASVEWRSCEGAAYSLVTDGCARQVHGGGIACDWPRDATAVQALEAFDRMRAVLRAESMDFGHVVRQWGYIEGLLEIRADCPRGHQRYQAFNDVRTQEYDSAEFPAGYPAATGIGQAWGGVALEFIALDCADARIEPVSNPRQTDAHHYSGGMLVGESLDRIHAKSTPKFERAKLVERGDDRLVFVSGTAAIVGERSVAQGDVAEQTRTTIENIAALVGEGHLSRLRAYVKRASDFATVRSICSEAFGPIPANYVQADICRPELLVELEGAVRVGAAVPVARAGAC